MGLRKRTFVYGKVEQDVYNSTSSFPCIGGSRLYKQWFRALVCRALSKIHQYIFIPPNRLGTRPNLH